jgi:hypothetical protein
MSKRTRTKRPTTATPRKVGTSRYVHVSAPLVEAVDHSGKPTGLHRVAPGTTYRKPR